MITITNGQMILTVPNSAYDTLYKSAGFHPIEDEKNAIIVPDTITDTDKKTLDTVNLDEEKANSDEGDEYETEAIDLSEIPLGEMDFYQLTEYADQLGIDHTGIRSKRELRTLIKDNL